MYAYSTGLYEDVIIVVFLGASSPALGMHAGTPAFPFLSRGHLSPPLILPHSAPGLLAHPNSFTHYPHLPIKPEEIKREPVTSTMEGEDGKPARIKTEVPTSSTGDDGKDDGEDDFIEKNCHWKGCGIEFTSQDDLVKVSLIK